MRVLMLGWEYPPHISGGLGTACEGLTRALAKRNVNINFVIPRVYGDENSPHMKIWAPDDAVPDIRASLSTAQAAAPQHIGSHEPHVPVIYPPKLRATAGIHIVEIPSTLSPYLNPETYRIAISTGQYSAKLTHMLSLPNLDTIESTVASRILSMIIHASEDASHAGRYRGGLYTEVARFSARVLSLPNIHDHDLIHAHDWMTYPAAIALRAMTGLPLVVHVHSLEFDRSGDGANREIEEIERAGIAAANRVIAVSYYTRELIHRRYGTPLDKIDVVHNGVYSQSAVSNYRRQKEWPAKIVLFLGRVTFQKGPDYFVEAAARVIPHVPSVLFVMAGSGDMLPQIMNRVNELRLSSNFLFTGFLKGEEVEHMYSMADLYVMPSVSEPFGISALEAISFNTPVIISKQSGVSEVLRHALKVDFWDVEKLANLIISTLNYPALSQDITSMANEEVRSLRWDASAEKTIEVYGHIR